ncbi:Gfo/Idh/MocA family oxidoreductase [Rhodococcus sp. NPDC058521]|uniref:Gfo/Idh/MocA family oxidoreductase n=1 Tax=Rhodococcus sp. NPDC058521 TaxID=3346536 RepID=UPI00366062A1
MTPQDSARLDVDRPTAVVVGATFGAVYAEALMSPSSPVSLVGVVGTGSQTSIDLAERWGIPLYTSIADVPPVDIAIVVVRSGIVGGSGSRLAADLLERGVNVLQEQPVHADEMLDLLKTAARHSVMYAVNDFYSSLAPVRQFVSATKVVASKSPVEYVHARCSLQVAYPMFTILADLVPALAPARIDVPKSTGGPFASGRLTLGAVPVDLLVQNELCASDPDNYAQLMHEVTVGTRAGELILTHTHGATHWRSQDRTVVDTPMSEIVGTDFDPTLSEVRHELWPDGVRYAVAEFVQAIAQRRRPLSQRFIRATRLWSEFTAALGPAELIEPTSPVHITAKELTSP